MGLGGLRLIHSIVIQRGLCLTPDFSGHAFLFLLHLYSRCVLVFKLRATSHIRCVIF